MSNLNKLFPPLSKETQDSLSFTERCWNDFDTLSEETQHYFDELTDYSVSCSDLPHLQKHTSHYLFVYDAMKSGFRRDKELLEFPCVAVGYTKSTFKMYRETVAPHYENAVVMLSGGKAPYANVYGEIYQVTPDKICELDWHESNNVITKRLKLPFDVVIDGKGTVKQIYAYMYVGLWKYWDTRMHNLRPADVLVANGDKRHYYNFMKKYETILN